MLLEGIAPGAEHRAAQARAILGAGATESEEPPEWWGSEPASSGALLKVSHEIARTAQLLDALDAAGEAAGLTTTLRGSPAVGTALVGVEAPPDGSRPTAGAVGELVDRLRDRSATFGGSVVVLEAPAEIREHLDVWGPVSALGLMHSVKERFDPERRLAPGRFVGGI